MQSQTSARWPSGLRAVLLMTALALVTPTGFAAEPDEAPGGLKVGDFAPQFLMKTLNPKESGVEMFSTKRVVGSQADQPKAGLVVTFAASWCKPCKRELPEIKKLADRYADKGIATVVVVVDREPAATETMRSLLVDELKFSHPVLTDRFGVVGRRYFAEELPMTVVVDADAKIVWLRSGYDEKTARDLERELKELAKKAANRPSKGK